MDTTLPLEHTRPPAPGYREVMVDVVTEIEIARPRDEVAAYAADPDNATALVREHRAGRVGDAAAARHRSRLAFVAQFLGRRVAYTYEVVELVPGERLVMRTAEGPFPMETTYTWADTSDGATRMTLRNRGEPAGFTRLGAPMMSMAMRRANRNDLREIKRILEAADGYRRAPSPPARRRRPAPRRRTSPRRRPGRRARPRERRRSRTPPCR